MVLVGGERSARWRAAPAPAHRHAQTRGSGSAAEPITARPLGFAAFQSSPSAFRLCVWTSSSLSSLWCASLPLPLLLYLPFLHCIVLCKLKNMSRSTAVDPFLGKESLAALARMGFGKREARLGPHRYHGVAARTRLSVAGKVRSSIQAQPQVTRSGCKRGKSVNTRRTCDGNPAALAMPLEHPSSSVRW